MRGLRRYRGRDVIVNVSEGRERAFRGVVEAVQGNYLVLRDAQVIDPVSASLDGVAVIPTDLITWVQVI